MVEDWTQESEVECRKRIWLELGIVVLIAVVPYYAALLNPHQAFGSFGGEILSLVINPISICLVILYLMWRSEMSWEHFGLSRHFDVSAIGIFFAASISAGAIAPILTSAFTMLDPTPIHDRYSLPDTFRLPSGNLQWAVFGFALFVNAAAEELAIRGFLTTRLADVMSSKVLAVTLPAALFGGYHLYQGWPAATSIFVIGILFGAMQLSTKRLMPLILAHAVTNIYVFSTYANAGK